MPHSYPDHDEACIGPNSKLTIEFALLTDGHIGEVKITRSICREIDSMVIAAVNAVPRRQPIMRNGMPVKVYFRMPIQIHLDK